MPDDEKFLTFLCSGAAKAGEKKLSFRIATHLEQLNVARIGTLQNLSEQQRLSAVEQKRMIFINDCRSGCVRVLTHGIASENYVYLDVSPHIGAGSAFDVAEYVSTEIFLQLKEKWDYSPG